MSQKSKNIVKNRPVTHDRDRCEDTKALTPNHFFIRKYSSGSKSKAIETSTIFGKDG